MTRRTMPPLASLRRWNMRDVRLVQVLRRLGAPLGVAQEGTLQVDAGALGAVRRAAEVPDGVHGGGEGLLLQGHGGGQEGGDAVGGVVVGP